MPNPLALQTDKGNFVGNSKRCVFELDMDLGTLEIKMNGKRGTFSDIEGPVRAYVCFAHQCKVSLTEQFVSTPRSPPLAAEALIGVIPRLNLLSEYVGNASAAFMAKGNSTTYEVHSQFWRSTPFGPPRRRSVSAAN